MGRQRKALVFVFLALLSAPAFAIDGYHLTVYFNAGSDIENPPGNWLDGKYISMWIEKGQYPGTIGGLGLHPAHAFFNSTDTGNSLRMMNKPHSNYAGVRSFLISDVPPRINLHAPDGSVLTIDEAIHNTPATAFRHTIVAPNASQLFPYKTTLPMFYFPEHVVLHICEYYNPPRQGAYLCLSDANSLSPFHLQVNNGSTTPQMMRRTAQTISHGSDPLRVNDVYYINY